MEDPVYTVFVVRSCEYMRNDEFPASSHDDAVISEISVFEEDTGIFLVNADGILNSSAFTCSVDECSY